MLLPSSGSASILLKIFGIVMAAILIIGLFGPLGGYAAVGALNRRTCEETGTCPAEVSSSTGAVAHREMYVPPAHPMPVREVAEVPADIQVREVVAEGGYVGAQHEQEESNRELFAPELLRPITQPLDILTPWLEAIFKEPARNRDSVPAFTRFTEDLERADSNRNNAQQMARWQQLRDSVASIARHVEEGAGGSIPPVDQDQILATIEGLRNNYGEPTVVRGNAAPYWGSIEGVSGNGCSYVTAVGENSGTMTVYYPNFYATDLAGDYTPHQSCNVLVDVNAVSGQRTRVDTTADVGATIPYGAQVQFRLNIEGDISTNPANGPYDDRRYLSDTFRATVPNDRKFGIASNLDVNYNNATPAAGVQLYSVTYSIANGAAGTTASLITVVVTTLGVLFFTLDGPDALPAEEEEESEASVAVSRAAAIGSQRPLEPEIEEID